MKSIFFGMPGVGKGTQAQIIAQKKGAMHVSTGDMLREAIKNQTAVGLKAKSYMDKGELVPDTVLIDLIEHLFQSGKTADGFIFDGFPRTLPQAESLDGMLKKQHTKIEVVFNIFVSEEEIIKRMSGRFFCKQCGAIYNKYYSPTQKENTCDACSSTFFEQRKDDAEDVVKSRLKVYHQLTEPVLGYYQKQGLVINIDASKPIDEVTKEILSKA